MAFEYSVIMHEDTWSKSGAYLQGREFAYSPLGVFVSEGNGKLPQEMSFLKVEPKDLIVTAIKKWERGDGMIVRFYNIGGERTLGTIRPSFSFSEVWRANLDEEPKVRIQSTRDRVELVVGPHEIVTLLFKNVRFGSSG
jgi:alpha-mannosidase